MLPPGEESEGASFHFGKKHINVCYSLKPTSLNRTKFDTEHKVDEYFRGCARHLDPFPLMGVGQFIPKSGISFKNRFVRYEQAENILIIFPNDHPDSDQNWINPSKEDKDFIILNSAVLENIRTSLQCSAELLSAYDRAPG